MSERIVAVVPVRSFRHGKSRLPRCSVAETRGDLLRQHGRTGYRGGGRLWSVDTVLVVSPDPETLHWAADSVRRSLPRRNRPLVRDSMAPSTPAGGGRRTVALRTCSRSSPICR